MDIMTMTQPCTEHMTMTAAQFTVPTFAVDRGRFLGTGVAIAGRDGVLPEQMLRDLAGSAVAIEGELSIDAGISFYSNPKFVGGVRRSALDRPPS